MKKKVLGLIDGQSGNIGSIKKAIRDLIKEKPYQLKVIQGSFIPNNFDKIIFNNDFEMIPDKIEDAILSEYSKVEPVRGKVFDYLRTQRLNQLIDNIGDFSL